ncbi:hypothetical protein FOZ62_004174 [Perkinsus olseni]|uniref:Uncharacterized protein n=1 Tax=Perkinsus olseni TaxID=32597 RepID=A0A7J6N777_PEROL|nr:hypothetical protein FOZ62_004174 [Perkinsus olseni]
MQPIDGTCAVRVVSSHQPSQPVLPPLLTLLLRVRVSPLRDETQVWYLLVSGPSASASTLQTSPFVDHSVSLPGEEGVPAAAPRRQPRYKARREVAQQPDTSAGQG